MREDPYRNFMFKVDIADFGEKFSFSDVSVADSTTDVIDYREGANRPTFQKLSGLTKFGSITLKRGITKNSELVKWYQNVKDQGATNHRKDVAIHLLDELGAIKATWNVSSAWPTKYSPADLSAKGNEVFIETLELAHEGINRSK